MWQHSWRGRSVLPWIFALGAAMGFLFVPSEVSQAWDCEKNACDVNGGNCQLVTHDLNCGEEPDGCKDAVCDPVDPEG